MARILLVLAVFAVAFWVVSIVDAALQPPTRHRGVPKRVWLGIVLLLPVIGGVLWFIIGRGPLLAPTPVRAPDDDREFIARLGTPAEQDERIRQLEQELARLDAEDDPSAEQK